jgi:hypothetical protein
MDMDRGAVIRIGDREYNLLLTTRATRESAGRCGGLENLRDRILKAENFEQALSEIVWLIALLANQEVMIHNLKHPEDKKELLTEEEIELLTNPGDLTDYRDAIMQAMTNGTKRNVESEPDTKNTEAG